MPNMSPLGIPAAVTLVAMFVLFVVAVFVVDYYFADRWGAAHGHPDTRYTMTFGLRYLYFHVPIAAITLLLAFGYLCGAVAMHLAQYIQVSP